MLVLRPILALACLSLLACRSGADEPPRTITAETVPVTATPRPTPTVPPQKTAEPDPTPAPTDNPPLPMKYPPRAQLAEPPALGAPCTTPNAAAGPDRFDACGTKQRVAVRWSAGSTAMTVGAPCKMQRVGKLEKPGTIPVGGYMPSACMSEGQLWATSACVMCRMAEAGWSAIARIDEMTSAQALAIQEKLGLPHTSPLVGEAAWARAIAASSK